ncbi:MAG: MAPEG family protein [Devosia sp.]
MSIELSLLFWSLMLYALYLGAQSLIYRWRHGVLYAQTARDDAPPEGALLGRAERALKNFLETWPAFIILALVAHLAVPGDALVFWGAITWYAARIVYLPLYLFGVIYMRSLVWVVSATGLFLMFIGVLF